MCQSVEKGILQYEQQKLGNSLFNWAYRRAQSLFLPHWRVTVHTYLLTVPEGRKKKSEEKPEFLPNKLLRPFVGVKLHWFSLAVFTLPLATAVQKMLT